MTVMKGLLCLLASACLLSGCSILPKPATVGIDRYLLESASGPQATRQIPADAPVIVIALPRANGGYDTSRIAYMQEDYGLRYYARSRWVDTPARMLGPLLADAVQATGQFHALYATPGLVAADMRLDTELVRLHQDFRKQPSEMRITLRAQLIDLDKGKVIATWLFDQAAQADMDNAYGGVIAANRLSGQMLDELARFCVSNRP